MRLGINGRFLSARRTGVQRFAREVTTRLTDRADVTLFVPAGSEPDGIEAARVVRGRSPGALWEQFELPRSAARAGLDVLLHPANACPLFGGPHVQVLHDLTPITHPRHFGLAYRLWARWAHVLPARRAARVITVSEHWAEEISGLVGIPRDRIVVVRQGVAPLDSPATGERVETVRLALGLPARYFLAVGVHDARKGFDFLTAAFERWCDENPDVDDVGLVGVGGRYERVHTEVRVEGGVRLVGHVSDEDLRALYTGSLALLFPSEEEGFGRPPLEAMACGSRVVVAPYPAASAVLRDAADIVARDVSAWGDALSRVVGEPTELRRARIERGQAIANMFTWDETVNGILAVCEAVADKRGIGTGTPS